MKLGIKYSREEVLVLEDVGFQLHFHLIIGFQYLWHSQSMDVISLCERTWMHTQLPGLVRQCVAFLQHRKWITKTNGKAILMDRYFVVEVTAILYPRFGAIVNIVFKKDISYHITIGNFSHCTCLDFTKMDSHALREKGKWDFTNIFIMYSCFYARWITTVQSSFMLQCMYNEVMWLVLVGIAERNYWC